MYTIKQAARLTGVPEASLRAWESRYGVIAPRRTASGYRLYDPASLAVVSTMRRLIEEGWAPAAAASALRNGTVDPQQPLEPESTTTADRPQAATYLERFLTSATRMDVPGIEAALDGGFALGSFEHVADSWLFPTLEALGEGWARGEIDVAGEHLASHAVLRRLSASFDAAASSPTGPRVVVGLPSGSQHELGALAFATAVRRRGMDVLYLGANVPISSWETAVESHAAQAAVLAVVTREDRPTAVATAERVARRAPSTTLCSGGAWGADLAAGVRELPAGIGAAAHELDGLLRG